MFFLWSWWLLVSKKKTYCWHVPVDRLMLPVLTDPKQIQCLFSIARYLKICRQRRRHSSELEWRCARRWFLSTWRYSSFIIFRMWTVMLMMIIIQIAWHSSEKQPAGGACAPPFPRFGFRSSLCVCPPVPQFDHPGQRVAKTLSSFKWNTKQRGRRVFVVLFMPWAKNIK